MRIATRPRRPKGESIIPMINVVFLLLIFFLMTAQIAPPEPFDVSPPDSSVDTPAEGREILHVAASGDMAFNDARGQEAVLAALQDFPAEESLMLRADRGVPAEVIAALLPKLADVGVRQLKLVSAAR